MLLTDAQKNILKPTRKKEDVSSTFSIYKIFKEKQKVESWSNLFEGLKNLSLEKNTEWENLLKNLKLDIEKEAGIETEERYRNNKKINFDFKTDIKAGKLGETATKRLLYYLYGENFVYDCSETSLFQVADIDFISYNKKEKSLIGFEVKTDLAANRTGNIPFEISSNGTPGCLFRSASNFVIYVTAPCKEDENLHFYIINLKEWRNKIFDEDPQKRGIRFSHSMGEGAYGHLCAIRPLLEENIAFKLF